MKKRYQRPLANKTTRIPQRELPTATVTQEKSRSVPHGEHWSMKPEPHVQGSAIKRSQWKGKEIWRPRPPERKLPQKKVSIGVTSGAASQRSVFNKNHQQWVPKEKVPITDTYNSRHFSKESYCQPTSTSRKKVNFDRTPPIEEVPIPHAEPEIYWKRRSEIRVQENDDDEDTMEVEVVYMVGHGDEPHQTRGYRRRNEAGPTSSKTTTSQEDKAQDEQLEEEEVPSGDGQNDDQDEEVLAETLAQAQRRLKLQMKEKDKEISELNSKMIEMMAQMTAMMQLMQKNITATPALAQPVDHQILNQPVNQQILSSIPTNLPTDPIPQVSGIRTTLEGGNEADRLVHLQTHHDIANTSEPVMTPQLESIINEKIQAVIASEHVEKFVSKGRPYPAEYDQVPYPKGYSVPKFHIFHGTGNPKQHLAQFKATCGNTGGVDALLFRQFISSLTATAFEWYTELPNDICRIGEYVREKIRQCYGENYYR